MTMDCLVPFLPLLFKVVEYCFDRQDRPFVAFVFVHRSVMAVVVIAVLERFRDVSTQELVPSYLVLGSYCFVQGAISPDVLCYWAGVVLVFVPFLD